ncbi:MAG: hypothetical protein OHK0022_47500 [Roseiflexaceae bacterium]
MLDYAWLVSQAKEIGERRIVALFTVALDGNTLTLTHAPRNISQTLRRFGK